MPGSFAASMFGAAARGSGLIALAVVIGIVLLQVSDDSTEQASGGRELGQPVGTEDPSPAEPSSTTTTGPVTTTAMTLGPADVTVLVLNGSGRDLQAGPLSERLAVVGYQTLEAGNAPLRETSVVLCRPSHSGAADALVAATGLTAEVETLEDDSGFPGAAEADCVVVIGSR
ncbi:MAG: LytR C-terminal domain-containing protein [Acidimicrobiia bacterium]